MKRPDPIPTPTEEGYYWAISKTEGENAKPDIVQLLFWDDGCVEVLHFGNGQAYPIADYTFLSKLDEME